MNYSIKVCNKCGWNGEEHKLIFGTCPNCNCDPCNILGDGNTKLIPYQDTSEDIMTLLFLQLYKRTEMYEKQFGEDKKELENFFSRFDNIKPVVIQEFINFLKQVNKRSKEHSKHLKNAINQLETIKEELLDSI